MPRTKSRGEPASSIHQLKITLTGIRPPIWRRVLTDSDITLAQLHDIIQAAMGWHDGHLHEFAVAGERFGNLAHFAGEDPELRNEAAIRLAKIAPNAKDRLFYTYDFGDSWRHEILVEAVTSPAPGTSYPVCVTGRRACPPEDCGGVWGYVDLLEALADPENPEHADLTEWVGGPFDPAVFDLAAVNRRLAMASR